MSTEKISCVYPSSSLKYFHPSESTVLGPIRMTNEEMRERIWQAVAAIPEGYVATYGQVAELAGLPRMARFVGRTLSQLPKDTKLPWHRVINAAGKISFPEASAPYLRQRERLENEGVAFINGKIRLKTYQWQP